MRRIQPVKKDHSYFRWLVRFFGSLIIILVLFYLEETKLQDIILLVHQTKVEIPQITKTADIKAGGFILTDSKTGQVIYQKNDQDSLPIASISKILPTYLIYQAIAKDKLKLTDQIKISPEIAKLSVEPGLSNVPLSADKTYSVQDLLHATLLSSANAGIAALAQSIGTLAEVNEKEHQFLDEVGIKDYTIINVNGMPNNMLGSLKVAGTNDSDENKLSAKDVDQVAMHLIDDYPQVLKITKEANYLFAAGTDQQSQLTNSNLLVKGGSLADGRYDVVGLKTGTDDNNYSLVGVTEHEQHKIITVVLKATSNDGRFGQTKQFLQNFYDNYHLVTIDNKTNSNLAMLISNFQKQYQIAQVKIQPLELWVPKEVKANDFDFNFAFDYQYFKESNKPGLILSLDLPTKKAEFIGSKFDRNIYLR